MLSSFGTFVVLWVTVAIVLVVADLLVQWHVKQHPLRHLSEWEDYLNVRLISYPPITKLCTLREFAEIAFRVGYAPIGVRPIHSARISFNNLIEEFQKTSKR